MAKGYQVLQQIARKGINRARKSYVVRLMEKRGRIREGNGTTEVFVK